ncbi:MAG: galactokinase [Rikenellaceae bacterium]
MEQKVSNQFEAIFNTTQGNLYSAAGRINLIGEHTDYNEGFVMPGAIDKVMVAKILPTESSMVKVYAIDLDEMGEFDPYVECELEQSWLRYIYGVCREVIKRGGNVEGFKAAFSGSVPLGSGLSSSAALESVFAFAINDLFNENTIDKMELARIGQSTEHNYCGVKCGIMDQFASIFGLEGNLIRLDCRSMEYEYLPFDAKGYRLVLLNTCVKHELVDSPYNRRRESCERVAATLGMPSLRGATMEQLDAVKGKISEEDYSRARFVIGEEQRVYTVSDALKAGDMERVGKAMYQTHDGLSGDYEVSCEELDFLANVAKECGVTGARMMGGGFGGCTINLVKDEAYDSFIDTALAKYKAQYGIDAEVIAVNIKNGAQKLG